MSRHRLLAIAIAAAAAPASLHAQNPASIAARVAAAPADGVVEMRFPARAGVCGDGGRYISLGRHTLLGEFNSRDDLVRRGPCEPGPVHAVLTLRGHDVARVRTYVGGEPATAGAVDLGVVDPRDAAAYLLGVARDGDGRAADDAILPAVLADRAVVWPALLAIARDSGGRGGGHSRGTRSTAGFWLSRFAAAARDGHPEDLAALDDDDEAGDDGDDGKKTDVRGQAVFALSQLPRHEGVPSLIEVARTHRDAAVRHKALFWLGQSDDPRALALFEEMLAKR